MSSVSEALTVSCTVCHYEREVGPDDESLPAEYIIEHGKETGHNVGISRLDSE